MRSKRQEQIFAFLRHRLPLFSSLLLMLLFFMPINSVQINFFRPAIGVICVYYWRLNRPSLFGWLSAFCIGFIIDIYSSSPLGINTLLMLGLVGAVGWLCRYFQTLSFSVRWLIFSLAALAFTLSKWLLLMLYFTCWLPISEIMVGYFSTVMFYPLIAAFNAWLAHKFLPPENINEQ